MGRERMDTWQEWRAELVAGRDENVQELDKENIAAQGDAAECVCTHLKLVSTGVAEMVQQTHQADGNGQVDNGASGYPEQWITDPHVLASKGGAHVFNEHKMHVHRSVNSHGVAHDHDMDSAVAVSSGAGSRVSSGADVSELWWNTSGYFRPRPSLSSMVGMFLIERYHTTLLHGGSRLEAYPRFGGLEGDETRTLIQQIFLDSMPARHVIIESIDCDIESALVAKFLRRVQEDRATVEAAFAFYHSSGTNVTKHAGVAHQHVELESNDRRCVDVILMMVGGRGPKGPQGKDVSVIGSDAQYSFVRDDSYLLSHHITYRTQGGEKRRVGGGWDDPFARALSNALQRANNQQKK